MSPSVLTGNAWAELTWNGWVAVGAPVSLYSWTTFSLVPERGVLVPAEHGHHYTFHSPPLLHPFRMKPRPGIYLLTLTVHAGQNSTKAQQLLLVDRNSFIVKCPHHPMRVSSGHVESGRVWLTNKDDKIAVTWFGRFYNEYVRMNSWLLYPVRRDPSVDEEYRLSGYPLDYDGIPTYNESGILNFNASLHMRFNSAFQLASYQELDGLNQSFEADQQLQSGHWYRLSVRAIDVFGHTASDAVDVLTDFTPPVMNNVFLVKAAHQSIRNSLNCTANVISARGHSLSFRVVDAESGIDRIEWSVGREENASNVDGGIVRPAAETKVLLTANGM